MNNDTIFFASPCFVCDECGTPIVGFKRATGLLVPCGHRTATSTCSTWGPVDGCQCPTDHGSGDTP